MSVLTSTNLPRSGLTSGDDDSLTDFDGAAEILRTWGAGLTPDPDLTVSQWADRHRMLSGRASAEPGRYRTARTPYMREIMDRLSPGDVMQRIVFMKAAQVGATEAGNNWIGFAIHQAPGPMLAVQPTVELAKRNSRQRIDPTAAAFTASPWAYRGKVFSINEFGVTFVVEAGPEFKLLYTNELASEPMCMSTPAMVGDRLLLRTASELVCFQAGARLAEPATSEPAQ